MITVRRLTALLLAVSLLVDATPAQALSSGSSAPSAPVRTAPDLDIPDSFARPLWNPGVAERLVDQGYLAPGFETVTHDRSCSAGFITRDAADDPVMVTAGHCGEVGDAVHVRQGGQRKQVGHVVHSEYVADHTLPDVGLVALTSPASVSPRLAGTDPVVGTLTVEQVQEQRPQLCRYGAASGFSCGEYLGMHDGKILFANIADSGDSGGPVVALVDDRWFAVGITSWMLTGSRPVVAAEPLAPVLAEHGLQLAQG